MEASVGILWAKVGKKRFHGLQAARLQGFLAFDNPDGAAPFWGEIFRIDNANFLTP